MKHLGLLGNGGALDQDEISILDSRRTTDGHALAEGAGGVSIGLPVEIFDVVIEAQCFEEESCANCTGRLQEVECDWRHDVQVVSVLGFRVGRKQIGLSLSIHGSTILISLGLADLMRHHLLKSKRGFDFIRELEQLTVMSEVKCVCRKLEEASSTEFQF